MGISIVDGEALWDRFLQRWPLEKLNQITLQEYTKAGDPDCFTYGWLEQTTENLGSIWGGSAFKFGVYSRKDKSDKKDGSGRSYSTEYGWYSKYGKNLEEAFGRVRAIIVDIANAARSGNIDAIEKADLGSAIKWKIAFLYQDRSAPTVLPVYSKEHLAAFLKKTSKANFRQLQQEVMSKRDGVDVLTYGLKVWNEAEALLSALVLKPEDALAFFQDNQERYQPIKPPTKYVAGFTTGDGRSLAVSLNSKKEAKLWLEPGTWLGKVKGQLKNIEHYSADQPRHSNLAANAPGLEQGNPAIFLTVPTHAALIALCDAYDNSDIYEKSHMTSKTLLSISESVPLNKILYGPPGTGKTYKTARLAVEICDGSADVSREELMRRYEELRKDGRINLVTFHQSYGYEDFIEGLRPELKDGQVSYSVRPGVFREVCDAARRSTMVKPGLSGVPLKDRTIYKMSLGIAGTNEGKLAFQECIEKGYVLLGYGHDVDFSECKSAEEIRKKVDDDGSFEKPDSHTRYMSVFKEELKVGDIIVVSQGNRAFRAIGEVTGEYEFLEAAAAGHFHQMRPVRWLAVFEGNRAVQEIYDRNFVQSALYRLDQDGLRLDVLEQLLKGEKEALGGNQAFVLIIDEINRANISKVFGELITLLEPDKREGLINSLIVKLPYSGDDFSIPANLYIVGTMNTADRSIALLDTALRRRFDFEELQPDIAALPEAAIDGIDLRAMLQAMNERIEYLYDRDHMIGHAYFINVETIADLDAVFRRKVIPLLQEYFYEDWAKVRQALNDNEGAFIESRNSVPNGLDSTLEGYEPKPRFKVKEADFPLAAYLKLYQ